MAKQRLLYDFKQEQDVPLEALPYGLTPDDVRDYCRAVLCGFCSMLVPSVEPFPGPPAWESAEGWFTITTVDKVIQPARFDWVLGWKNRTTDGQVLIARSICQQLPQMANDAMQAGLFETYRLLQQAVQKVGWETAALQEKALRAPEPTS